MALLAKHSNHNFSGRAIERAKIEALFNSVGEGVLTTNEQGKLDRINDVALQLFGFTRQEVIGKWYPAMFEAVYEDGSPIKRLDRPITKAFLIGKSVTERIFYKRKDGSIFPAEVNVSPIIVDNRPLGAVEILRDISFETELDRIKTDFMSLASHQLRTPLSAISTYSNMLAEGYAGDLNEDQRSFIEIILSAVKRMNDLINILLNVTRVETGNITVRITPTNIPNLVQELVKQFKAEAFKYHIAIRVHDHLVHPKLQTDSLLLKEVLSNFISNALKYGQPHSKVNVTLAEKGSNVIISVEDTGLGIPADVQDHIFTKFFRATNVTQQDVSGTGLGLYLTKIIVENLDGEIWFTSEEGKGTTFFISLPLAGGTPKSGKFRLERN